MKIVLQKYTIERLEKPLKNLRCLNCGSLLGRFGDLTDGILQIKCKSCHQLNDFKFPVDKVL